MKKSVFAFFLVSTFSGGVFAKTLSCDIFEYSQAETLQQQIVVSADESDPHGSLTMFRGQNRPEISGFVSLMEREGRTFAVLNLYSEKTGVQSSGHFQMLAEGQYAQIQYLVPSESASYEGIEIVCQFSLQ